MELSLNAMVSRRWEGHDLVGIFFRNDRLLAITDEGRLCLPECSLVRGQKLIDQIRHFSRQRLELPLRTGALGGAALAQTEAKVLFRCDLHCDYDDGFTTVDAETFLSGNKLEPDFQAALLQLVPEWADHVCA